MDVNLDEISKLLGEITQGEWWVDPDGPEYSVNYKGPLDTFRHVAMVSCYIHRQGDKEENEANARLIAAAPTIIRELVERVRVLENVREQAEEIVSWADGKEAYQGEVEIDAQLIANLDSAIAACAKE